MTRDALLARKQELEAQRQQVANQLAKSQQEAANANNLIHAISGAIQDTDFWLAQLAKKEEEAQIVGKPNGAVRTEQAGEDLKQ